MPCSSCSDQTCFTGQGQMPDRCPDLKGNLSDTEEPAKGFIEFATRTQGKKITRMNEVIQYADFMDYKKIGIACCIGLHDELRIISERLKNAGFRVFSVMCKTGTLEKKAVGVPAKYRMTSQTGYGIGCAACNPVAQAFLLNREKTHMNCILGLCTGHDTVFMKYTQAPVVTLIAKDRSNGHNPASVLYNFYGDNFFQRRPSPEGAAEYNSKRIKPVDIVRMAKKKVRK